MYFELNFNLNYTMKMKVKLKMMLSIVRLFSQNRCPPSSDIYPILCMEIVLDLVRVVTLHLGDFPTANVCHVSCMYIMDVHHICMSYMYISYICHICTSHTYVKYVCHICMSHTYITYIPPLTDLLDFP